MQAPKAKQAGQSHANGKMRYQVVEMQEAEVTMVRGVMTINLGDLRFVCCMVVA